MSGLRRRLAELVGISSVSTQSNEPIALYLERAAEALGFTTRRFSYVDAAGTAKVNLVAATSFEAAPALALVGHTDTVPFSEWPGALALEEADGRLYGRGACDTKGFIACALEAASRIDRSSLLEPLAFVFTAEEELGCLGAKRLADARALAPRYAIVGEPTSLVPIRAHKGICLAQVEIVGREAHSCRPRLGASAIFAAGRFLVRLDELGRALENQGRSDFDPPGTTLSVGIISGGEAHNVVAGRCRLLLELRPLPGELPGRLLEQVRQLGQEVSAEHGVAVHVEESRADAGLETPASAELVRFLEQASGQAAATVPYATEAPSFAQMGAQAAVFGPGDIRVAHKSGEHVPVAELERCAEILTQAIAHFCAGG